MVVAAVIGLFVTHALLAMRKFPIDYRQFATFRTQMRSMRHEDTTLWFWQAITGFAMFFLAPGHLHMMLTRPDRIGPSNQPTASGPNIGGRCTSCYCLRWRCTAESGFTGLQ